MMRSSISSFTSRFDFLRLGFSGCAGALNRSARLTDRAFLRFLRVRPCHETSSWGPLLKSASRSFNDLCPQHARFHAA